MQSYPHGKINPATSFTETFGIRSQNKGGTEEHRGRRQLSPRTLRSRRLTQEALTVSLTTEGTPAAVGRVAEGRQHSGHCLSWEGTGGSARNKEAEARGTPRLEAGPGA